MRSRNTLIAHYVGFGGRVLGSSASHDDVHVLIHNLVRPVYFVTLESATTREWMGCRKKKVGLLWTTIESQIIPYPRFVAFNVSAVVQLPFALHLCSRLESPSEILTWRTPCLIVGILDRALLCRHRQRWRTRPRSS